MVLDATIFVITTIQYIYLTCDEVSTIDNRSWLLVHGFVVQSRLHKPLFFPLNVCWS
jgi:hypothetical protein